jgi:hypothetical protein
MTICSRCPSPARWRDPDGRQFCGSHVPANGKPLARLPAAKIDIVDRLEAIAAAPGAIADGKTAGEAAAEIRRLRAELDKSKAC